MTLRTVAAPLVDLSPGRGLRTAACLLVALASAVALTNNVADPDFWGHVHYGADALKEGLHRNGTYTYLPTDQPWINHEILSELAYALGVRWLGPPGLLVV